MSDRIVKLETVREERMAFDGMRVLAWTWTDSAAAALSDVFGDLDGAECVFAPAGIDAAGAIEAADPAPHAYFFEARSEDDAARSLAAIRRGNGANAHVSVLLPNITRTGTLMLLRAGADDVLTTRPEATEIIRALARASARNDDEPAGGGDDGAARTLAFLHASGGAGATTLAVNAALLLAQRLKGEKVCLIDFDLQFGDVDLHLDLSERSRVMEIVKTPERLDERMLEDLMIDGPKGLRVLTAADAPMPLDVFRAQTIETVLSLARKRYRYVIVDMPMALTQWTDAALGKCDHAFVVTQASVPALRATGRLLQTLRDEGALGNKETVLLNRFGAKSLAPKITLEQAAKALGSPVGFTLPSDYALLSDSIDQGIPAAMLRPASKFCEGLSAALDTVVEHKGAQTAASPVRQFLKFGR